MGDSGYPDLDDVVTFLSDHAPDPPLTTYNQESPDWAAMFHVKHGQRSWKLLDQYFVELKERNSQLNLYSRKTDDSALQVLLAETGLLLGRFGSGRLIDVGSGNGLLGIPISICLPERPVVLVESRAKKAKALIEFRDSLKLRNLSVFHGSLDEFMTRGGKRNDWLLARGFPRIEALFSRVKKNTVAGVTLVSAESKIDLALQGLESLDKKVYNVPWRENLVVAEITSVSRETGTCGKIT